jgi:crotonobetainyl-CoA:carnitine CoA-transferase CaiB-like acyl-CoA transferase
MDVAGSKVMEFERALDSRARLTDFFAGVTKSQVDDLFSSRDACVSVVRSFEEMLASPQAKARDYVVEVPGSPMPVLGFPARAASGRAQRGNSRARPLGLSL